jgi:hypothetical protein
MLRNLKQAYKKTPIFVQDNQKAFKMGSRNRSKTNTNLDLKVSFLVSSPLHPPPSDQVVGEKNLLGPTKKKSLRAPVSLPMRILTAKTYDFLAFLKATSLGGPSKIEQTTVSKNGFRTGTTVRPLGS